MGLAAISRWEVEEATNGLADEIENAWGRWLSPEYARDAVLAAQRSLGVAVSDVDQLVTEVEAFMDGETTHVRFLADYLYGALVLGIEA
jgi:nitrate/nitrite-specific signal transduction histidine kinase